MRLGWTAHDSFKRILWIACGVDILFVSIYTIIYLLEPFSEFWNLVTTNLFLAIAAFFPVMIASWIWRLYDRKDPPRFVWASFTVALFFWFAAELTWSYINITQGEVPIGWPDVFWIISYPIFGLALYSQYQILAHAPVRKVLVRSLMAVLYLVVFTLLTFRAITSLTQSAADWASVINSFYPVADLLLAVIAIRLARDFTGGAFSRPWLGLIVFAFSDLLYACLEISGLYTWSIEQGNPLTTISDVIYLTAYLAMGISLLYHWLFLKYGMRTR